MIRVFAYKMKILISTCPVLLEKKSNCEKFITIYKRADKLAKVTGERLQNLNFSAVMVKRQ